MRSGWVVKFESLFVYFPMNRCGLSVVMLATICHKQTETSCERSDRLSVMLLTGTTEASGSGEQRSQFEKLWSIAINKDNLLEVTAHCDLRGEASNQMVLSNKDL